MEKSGQKGRPPGGLDRERASPAERDREQEARERHTLPGGVESEPVCVCVCVSVENHLAQRPKEFAGLPANHLGLSFSFSSTLSGHETGG